MGEIETTRERRDRTGCSRIRFATVAWAMKAMTCMQPVHSGQASTRSRGFWSRSAQGTRYVRAVFVGSALHGFSVGLAGVPVNGTAGTASGAAGTICFLTFEFGA